LKNISQSRLKRHSPLIVAIAAVLAAPSIFGGGINLIDLTENSSTSLSATFNGSAALITVVNTGLDQWTVIFPEFILINPNASYRWTEPEGVNQVNLVTSLSGIENHQLFVTSDVSSNLVGASPNGTINPVPIGFDTSGGQSTVIFASFHDVAGASEFASVPDGGTTLSLLGISLVGLAFLRRRVG